MAVFLIEPPAATSLLSALITGARQLTLVRTMGRDPESKKVHNRSRAPRALETAIGGN